MQHPLSFFQRLLEKDSIEQLRTKFYSTYYEEMVLELDREREFMRITNPFDSESESIIRYFHNYFKELCIYEQHNTLSIVEADVLKASDKQKEKNYLLKVIGNIDSLIEKFQSNKGIEKYEFTISILKSIKEYIFSRYENKGLLSNTKEQISQREKIQWLGKTNVLVTLFYDLFNGQDKGDPLIHTTKNKLKKFISESFLDQEGNNLSIATIDTIFSESKVDKRAKRGDRVELPNKLILKK